MDKKNKNEEVEVDEIIDKLKEDIDLEEKIERKISSEYIKIEKTENELSDDNSSFYVENAKASKEEITSQNFIIKESNKKNIYKNKYKIITYVGIIVALLAVSLFLFKAISGKINEKSSFNIDDNKNNSSIENLLDEPEITPENVDINYKKIQPNEAGDILVVMYHNINNSKKRYPWQNSTKQFKRDLQYMYDNDYVLIGIDEYLSGKIDIPEGKTPILLTFDDGLKGTFSLIKNKKGELVVHPKSMVGILEQFKKDHPGFGTGGVLYVTNNPFDYDAFSKNKSKGSYKERFQYLIDKGYTIGNHTKNHPDLKTKSKKAITSEIGYVNKMVFDSTGYYNVKHFAYPYGSEPIKKNKSAVKKGKYKGAKYKIESAMVAAPEKPFFVSSVNESFKPYAISRVIGTKGRYRDLHWYLKYYKENPSKKYVSDGNIDVLSVPKSKKIKLNKKKVEKLNLIYYNKKTGRPLKDDGTEVPKEEISEKNYSVNIK